MPTDNNVHTVSSTKIGWPALVSTLVINYLKRFTNFDIINVYIVII